MAIADLFNRIETAIEKKDFPGFDRARFELVNICRKNILEFNKPTLKVIYPPLSSLLSDFYRSGGPEWPEIDRLMGGLEMVRNFVSNVLKLEKPEAMIEDIRRSEIDRRIIGHMAISSPGMRSGEVAEALGISQNSLTNRLPGLEKRGIILRRKAGKNSFLYLTPKGKEVAEILGKEATVAGEGVKYAAIEAGAEFAAVVAEEPINDKYDIGEYNPRRDLMRTAEDAGKRNN